MIISIFIISMFVFLFLSFLICYTLSVMDQSSCSLPIYLLQITIQNPIRKTVANAT